MQNSGSAGAAGRGGRRSIIVACAGLSFHCSQKIFNMVKVRSHCYSAFCRAAHTVQGLHCASSESEYILFLDDDVAIYPHTIQKLIAILSSDPNLFMVTGWPYDVLPNKCMPMACLCRIVYRWFSMFPLFKQRVP